MADKQIGKIPQSHEAQEVRADLTDYATHRGDNTRDAHGQTSGERLKDAAVAFEHTLGNDKHVAQLADQIKNGTPGTPEWDKLMKSVQEQLDGNNKQIAGVKDGITSTTKDLVAANTAALGHQVYGNMQITGA